MKAAHRGAYRQDRDHNRREDVVDLAASQRGRRANKKQSELDRY